MTRYLVKTHYEATEQNDRQYGRKCDFYIGKNGIVIGTNEEPYTHTIVEYGYTTKATASKGLKARQKDAEEEAALGFWNVTAELIEYHISQ